MNLDRLITALFALWNFGEGSRPADANSPFALPPVGTRRLSEDPPRPTACEQELRSNRYQNGIAGEFPNLPSGEPTIVSTGRNRNIACICVDPTHMLCNIVCTSTDMEAIMVTTLQDSQSFHRPLHYSTYGDTLPFDRPYDYIHPDYTEYPPVRAALILYPYDQDSPSIEEIDALMNVMSENNFAISDDSEFEDDGDLTNILLPGTTTLTPVGSFLGRIPRSDSLPSLSRPVTAIRRAYSSLSDLLFPSYIPMYVCTGGERGVSCPITQQSFEPGQKVFILKVLREDVLQFKTVGCISAVGLKSLEDTLDTAWYAGFRDPLRRTRDRLTIHRDFDGYILQSDEYFSLPEEH